MWITVMILGLVGAISIGMSTWNRYQDNPTVISMERDSRLFNTSFPAATICPTMKYDDTKFKELLQRSNGNKEEVQEFLEVLFNSSYENFVDFRNYSKSSMEFFLRTFPPKNYLDLIFDNRFNFSYAAVNSAEGSLPEVWIHMSEMGICYTYNSEVAMYNDPDYWSGEKSPREPFLILSGNEMDGDLFSQMMDMNSPSIVYIHGPEEIPDCASRSLVLPDLTYKTLDESALALYTTAEARGLSVRQRRCRLRHESDLELGPVYSYNLCRMECRLKQSLRLCSCVPFFYRNRGKYPICDLDGMKCLAAHNLSIGGTAGLFLGCSILSFIEIIYFFTLRLFWYIVELKRGKS
ncbi:Pickpocket protein 11 [Gryllus bimaculatus]|nr:Pickpocket protein 11 [Gryllus bimaculatus]